MPAAPHPLTLPLLSGNRRALAKAITLSESTRPEHEAQAQALLSEVLPRAGRSVRIGLTGVPGVGKSTFIEALGVRLADAGHRVAVLAVDPSSARTGGSIMGDKTRMPRLTVHPNAFIRPSPSGGTPRAAKNITGTVVRRSSSMTRGLVRPTYAITTSRTVAVGRPSSPASSSGPVGST